MSILLKSTTEKKDYNINVYKKEPKEAEHSSRTCKIQRSKKKNKKKTMNNSLKRKL